MTLPLKGLEPRPRDNFKETGTVVEIRSYYVVGERKLPKDNQTFTNTWTRRVMEWRCSMSRVPAARPIRTITEFNYTNLITHARMNDIPHGIRTLESGNGISKY